MEEEDEEECTSLLMGEMPLEPPDMAGEMSFLPKLSRLLDTLLMLSGVVLALGAELRGHSHTSSDLARRLRASALRLHGFHAELALST